MPLIKTLLSAAQSSCCRCECNQENGMREECWLVYRTKFLELRWCESALWGLLHKMNLFIFPTTIGGSTRFFRVRTTGTRNGFSSRNFIWGNYFSSYFRVGHWSQTQFLEGHSSAQFCSNPNQTHLIQLIKVIRITRNFQAGVSWGWLELNSAELWPSRNWVWDHWSRV